MRIKKKSAGFTLIEVVVGIAMVGVALGMVGTARQKRETVRRQVQTNIEQAAQARTEPEEITKVPTQEPQTEAEKEVMATPRKEPGIDEEKDTVTTGLPKNDESDASRQTAPRVEVPDTDENERERPRTSSDDQQDSGSFDVNECLEDFEKPGCIALLEAVGILDTGQNEQYDYYQQQQMFDPNQFIYKQFFPGLYQFFPGGY